jgi:hypothetical protein
MFDLITLPEEERLIVQALNKKIVTLSKDPQGTHVVQKVLKSFTEEAKR